MEWHKNENLERYQVKGLYQPSLLSSCLKHFMRSCALTSILALDFVGECFIYLLGITSVLFFFFLDVFWGLW